MESNTQIYNFSNALRDVRGEEILDRVGESHVEMKSLFKLIKEYDLGIHRQPDMKKYIQQHEGVLEKFIKSFDEYVNNKRVITHSFYILTQILQNHKTNKLGEISDINYFIKELNNNPESVKLTRFQVDFLRLIIIDSDAYSFIKSQLLEVLN